MYKLTNKHELWALEPDKKWMNDFFLFLSVSGIKLWLHLFLMYMHDIDKQKKKKNN